MSDSQSEVGPIDLTLAVLAALMALTALKALYYLGDQLHQPDYLTSATNRMRMYIPARTLTQ
jgi:hypothetical protein